MRRWLLDTGPLVAYVDAGDPAHEIVATALDGFTGRLNTTGAVLTEAMQLVAADPSGSELLVEFLIASRAEIAETTRPVELLAAVRLMRKYRDIPMDYADATLVLLADQLGVTEILTLDLRGFSIYRTPRGKAFRLLLPRHR